MIERYLEYLSAIRRYSPRTIEIYRGVLEDFASFSLSDLSGSNEGFRRQFAVERNSVSTNGTRV